jgi:hypothetical protein
MLSVLLLAYQGVESTIIVTQPLGDTRQQVFAAYTYR